MPAGLDQTTFRCSTIKSSHNSLHNRTHVATVLRLDTVPLLKLHVDQSPFDGMVIRADHRNQLLGALLRGSSLRGIELGLPFE